MAIGHAGSWSIGGWKLPDFGITERFTRNRTAQGGSNFFGPTAPVTYTPTTTQTQNITSNPIQVTSNPGQLPYTGGTTSTYNAPAPTGTTSEPQPSYDPYAQIRNEISSGWDSYINSLNDQLNGLPGQRTAQEQVVENQYKQGVNQMGLQRTQGLDVLSQQRTQAQQNQARTLKDLSSNLRNAFMAGNIYLGSRGAGDSSASNQYSYALTKEGTRQRASVMNQTSGILNEINGRETNLNNIYNTEMGNLKATYDTKVLQVAQWFSEAQNQIRQAKAQGQLNKDKDLANLSSQILNQGITMVNQINQNTQAQYSALVSWATSNSKNIQELKSNLGAISQYAPQLPKANAIAGTPMVDSSGNFRVPTGYGATNEQKKDLFGNFIS